MDSDHYVWESPAHDIAILVNLRLVERLEQLIREAPEREIGGFLLGNCDDAKAGSSRRVVQVEDFEPVPAEHLRGRAYALSPQDLRGLAKSLARARSRRGRVPVGFFRSHLRKGLYLDEADFSLFQAQFSGPCDVFLLARPEQSGVPVAGFFYWEDELLNRRNTYVTFPLDRAKLMGERHTLVSAPPAAPTPTKNGRRLLPVVVVSAKRWAYGTAGIVMILAALVLGAVMRLSGTGTAEGLKDVALSVQREGSELRLNWNAAAPAVAHANSAILWVSDGGQQRRVDLNANVLKQGSFVYSPQSNDVNFRLDLLNVAEQGTESVRYVGDRVNAPSPAAPPPIEAVVPAPKAKRVSDDDDNDGDERADRVNPRTRHKPVEVEPKPSTIASVMKPPELQQPAPLPPTAPAPVQQVMPKVEPARVMKPRPEPTVSFTTEPIAPHRRTDWVRKVIHLGRDKDNGEFVPPRTSHEVTPHVPPRLAREMPADVRLELRVSIDRVGAVYDIRLVSVSDPRLADLASAAVSQWHFEPAQFKDRPIASDLLVTMHFHNPGDGAVAQRQTGESK